MLQGLRSRWLASREAFADAAAKRRSRAGCRRGSTSRATSRCSPPGRPRTRPCRAGASRSAARWGRGAPGPGTSSSRCRRRHHHPPARRRDRRQGVGGVRVRGRAARPRARRPGPAARAAPLLLEEREVGARPLADDRGRARLLGGQRLPRLRRPVARAAVPGRLTWQLARVRERIAESPTARTLVLDVPGWNGHRAGQHIDVRLTAEDGYQAQRSFSIASAPEDPGLEITVERIEDGEVSPYLVEGVMVGDQLELRGPIGGWFAWGARDGGPLLLIGGGSGLVPLMSMLRHRRNAGSDVRVRLLLSA